MNIGSTPRALFFPQTGAVAGPPPATQIIAPTDWSGGGVNGGSIVSWNWAGAQATSGANVNGLGGVRTHPFSSSGELVMLGFANAGTGTPGIDFSRRMGFICTYSFLGTPSNTARAPIWFGINGNSMFSANAANSIFGLNFKFNGTIWQAFGYRGRDTQTETALGISIGGAASGPFRLRVESNNGTISYFLLPGKADNWSATPDATITGGPTALDNRECAFTFGAESNAVAGNFSLRLSNTRLYYY